MGFRNMRTSGKSFDLAKECKRLILDGSVRIEVRMQEENGRF